MIASQIINHLRASEGQIPQTQADQSLPNSSLQPTLRGHNCYKRNDHGHIISRYSFGVAFLTGVIELFILSNEECQEQRKERLQTRAENERALFRIRLHMPTWISLRVFDSIVHDSQIGWTQHLSIYMIYEQNSDEWGRVKDCIQNDDASTLLHLFQTRVIRPYDHIQFSPDISLIEVRKTYICSLLNWFGHVKAWLS